MGFCFSKNVKRTSEGAAPLFVCSGTAGTDYVYTSTTTNGIVNWEIKFLKDVSFTFAVAPGEIDVFLVGGGGAGGTWAGSGGGYTKTAIFTPAQGYATEVKVGAGGTQASPRGKTSSGFGFYANGGYQGAGDGGAGGSGGGAAGDSWDPYPKASYTSRGGNGGSDGNSGGYSIADLTDSGNDYGGDFHKKPYQDGGSGQGFTTRAFGEPNGTLYAGGGAGNSFDDAGGPGAGGGGGVRSAGATNTGGGGGGGRGEITSGGSGIVIIRNHRSTTVVCGLASQTGTLS